MYYKIVTKGTLTSYITDHEFFLQYIVGEWVYPKLLKSKIFIFDTFENAKAFAYKEYKDVANQTLSIYSCEALDVESGKYMLSVDFLEDLYVFWTGEYLYGYKDIPPNGTLFCGSVKLIEKMEY